MKGNNTLLFESYCTVINVLQCLLAIGFDCILKTIILKNKNRQPSLKKICNTYICLLVQDIAMLQSLVVNCQMLI